jgi:hypothetical protein
MPNQQGCPVGAKGDISVCQLHNWILHRLSRNCPDSVYANVSAFNTDHHRIRSLRTLHRHSGRGSFRSTGTFDTEIGIRNISEKALAENQ